MGTVSPPCRIGKSAETVPCAGAGHVPAPAHIFHTRSRGVGRGYAIHRVKVIRVDNDKLISPLNQDLRSAQDHVRDLPVALERR